jgi:hypothetical protein
MKFKVLMLVFFTVFLLLFLSGCTSNNTGDNSSNGNNDWLENYSPVHSVGTDSDDFWIAFPTGNPSVGQSVQHKTWVTEALEEKPVVFVCHRTGCISCTPQADRIKALGEMYEDDAIFFDLDDDYAGTATADMLKKYNEGFYYDPNGGTHYIALTGVFTIINEGGEEKIGWHSWEGNVDDVTMENWIKDAIYYYHMNSEDHI